MNSSTVFDDDISLKDPLEIFKRWLDAAKKNAKNPFVVSSFCLSTCDEQGNPSARLVTVTNIDEEGIYFLTNSSSRKAQIMNKNPQVSLTFYWPGIFRMVVIDGIVRKGSAEMADECFNKRPIKHKVWAHICEQGTTISNMKVLTDLEKFLTKKFDNTNVPRPPTWEVYVVKPSSFHFFLSQRNLKHDKVVFRYLQPGERINKEVTHAGKNGWVYERVFP